MKTELQKKFEDFEKSFTVILGQLSDNIVGIGEDSDVKKAVNDGFKESSYHAKFRDLFVLYMRLITGKSKSWVLRNKVSENITLSKAVWNNTNEIKGIIVNSLKETLGEKAAWNKTAQYIYNQNLSTKTLPKYVNQLIKSAQKMQLDSLDIKAFVDYKRKLTHLLRQVDKMTNVRVKKAYENLAKVTEGLSSQTLDKAVERIVKAKTKYYAERLVRNEMAVAYNNTFMQNITDEKVPAYKITLSAGHPRKDICDFHTKVDKYGMGPGVIPAKYDSGIPFHPHCMCGLTKVYAPEKKPTKYNQKAAKKFVENNKDIIPKKDRGKINSMKNPEKLIPSYEGEKLWKQ